MEFSNPDDGYEEEEEEEWSKGNREIDEQSTQSYCYILRSSAGQNNIEDKLLFPTSEIICGCLSCMMTVRQVVINR